MEHGLQRFADRVVVITGASQGLGRFLALAFAAEGAKVALAARSARDLRTVEREIADAGGVAVAIPTDVTDPAAVDALRDAVVNDFGPAHVLVNNAGIAGRTAVLWQQPLEDWEETIRVNLTGVFLCCRAFLPQMVERGRGNVVVIGSMTGKRPLYGRTPYAATKTALIGLVRTLAWEVGPSDVRVNLVSPGPLEGERLDRVLQQQARARGIPVGEAEREMAAASPLGRFVSAADVASAVLFLASDEARAMTGDDLNVSSGIVTFG